MKKTSLYFLPIALLALLSCEKSKGSCTNDQDINYHVADKNCDREATESQFLSDWTFTRISATDTIPYLVKIQTTASEYTVRMVTTFGLPQIDFANYVDLTIKQKEASTNSGSFTLNEVDFSVEITNFKLESNSPTTATMFYTMNGNNYADHGSRTIPN